MAPTEVVKHWESTFEKLGYRETKPNNWVKETKELIVVLKVLTLPGDYYFYVDVSLIIKKLYHYGALQRPVFRYHHLVQSLYGLLWYLHQKERYLNKLFSFNPITNTDSKIIANIGELRVLYQTLVVPLFNLLDYWVSEEEYFNDKEAWEPFYYYFQPTMNVDRSFWKEV